MSTRPSHEAVKLHAFYLWEKAEDKRDPLHWYYLALHELEHGWHRHPRNIRESQVRFFLSL